MYKKKINVILILFPSAEPGKTFINLREYRGLKE